jgi:superfamily I DNA/RNA helicase
MNRKRKISPDSSNKFDDEVLLSIGVPEPLLPSVRSLHNEAELDRLRPHIPSEACDGLFGLAPGLSMDEIREELAHTTSQAERASRQAIAKQEDQDLQVALLHPDSQRRFHIVEDLRDLMEMLNAPLQKWRVFLHPSQRRLVDHRFRGPARVLGGAGTGKTVVLMHRARELAKNAKGDEKILVTTFTRNLALAIQDNLKTICADELARIDVMSVDALASRILTSRGIQFKVASREEIDDCWNSAVAAAGELALPIGFYREEWDRVVQAQGIEDRTGYLLAPRIGRGTRLNRAMRAKVWDVFEEYQTELRSRGLLEWIAVARQARMFMEEEQSTAPYRSALVDESQDLHPEQWRLLRALIPEGENDLFLVGDAHQRIYARKIVLSRVGINVRGRSRTLRINYRTTDEIRKWAVGALAGKAVDDLDGEQVDERGYRSLFHGEVPVVRVFKTEREEMDFVIATIRERLKTDPPQSICVVARTRRQLIDLYIPAIEKTGISAILLDGRNSDSDGESVRVATMHRVKGLEFQSVLIVGVSNTFLPLSVAVEVGDDLEVADEALMRERALLYVAASRARDFLAVSASGDPSPFLLKA